MVLQAPDSWQFRLTETPTGDARRIGDLWLETGPGLPVAVVTDAQGAEAGLLLGFPIDVAGRRLIDRAWTSPASIGPDSGQFARDTLMALGGRFAFLSTAGGAPVLYPDCSAQVPVVYDPVARIAGTSAHALFDDAEYEKRFDRALYDHLGLDGEGWFPAGLTAHRGLMRLLPGHALDLSTWTVRRYWPLAPVAETTDPAAVVDEMVTIVRNQMEAILKGPQRLALALTAGHETRVLLACARPFVEKIDIVTVVGDSRRATDSVIARRITRDLGLRHLELQRRAGTDAERALYIRRNGHCNADSNARFHPSVRPLAGTHVFVGGLGGEVGRAFFWRPSDRPDTRITEDTLNARFGLPDTPALKAMLAEWLRHLPAQDAYSVLDMAYLEHRNGPWYAVQFCSDPTLLRQAPLMTLRAVELMWSLPPDWKRTSRLGHEIIAREWPELLRYPINSLGKFQDTLVKLRRVADNPALILKKLRKLSR